MNSRTVCLIAALILVLVGPAKADKVVYNSDKEDCKCWKFERLPADKNMFPKMKVEDPPLMVKCISEGEPDSGKMYFNVTTHGIAILDVATGTYEFSGVTTDATALGFGRDGYWYANGGDGAAEAKQFYRLLPELDGGGVQHVDLIGVGARRIEDIATSPDGTTIYGVGEGFLFRIDKVTGLQTDVGPIGFDAHGLAFSSSDLLTMDGSVLMKVNPVTAATTLVVDLIEVGDDDLAGSTNSSPSPWLGLGGGLAGTSGIPLLVGTGPLLGGTLLTIALTDARPSALAGLFLSLASTPIPFKGGTLQTFPIVPGFPVLLVTSGAGSITIPAAMPFGLNGLGLDLFIQYAIGDPVAINGVSLSNAIKGNVP